MSRDLVLLTKYTKYQTIPLELMNLKLVSILRNKLLYELAMPGGIRIRSKVWPKHRNKLVEYFNRHAYVHIMHLQIGGRLWTRLSHMMRRV
jgi:hypothetical protein